MKKTYTLLLLILFIAPLYGAVDDEFDVDNIRYRVTQEGTDNRVMITNNLDVTRTMVYIPDSVTNPNSGITYQVSVISGVAFSYSNNLKSIVIPASVQGIDVSAFWAMDSLAQIIVDPNNQSYTSIDGVLFTKNGKTLHAYPNRKDSVYILPAGVEMIGEEAFAERDYIKEVVFPSSLRIISKNAFLGAVNLRTINLEQTSIKYIWEFAFSNCYSLQEVNFPSTLNHIFHNAFEECYALTRADFSRVNDSIVVEREAFINCESLVTVDIPQKLLFVHPRTFKNCKSLITVDFSRTDSMAHINHNAFEGCSALPILDLSSLKHLHSIEGNAFLDNTSLTHIIFPPEFGDFSRSIPSFVEIAGTAFGNCSSLISIVNPQPIPQKAHPSAFNGVDKVACDVFVADSVLADYIAAPVWCDFFYSNLVVQPYDSNHGSTQGGGMFAFFAQDTLVATAKPGYAFVYWSNKEDSILSYNDTLIYTMKYNDSVTAHFRDLSDGDATLLSITPSAGTLSPLFTSQQFHYTDTVRYAVDSIRFSVVINSLGATVNGNDTLMRALNVGHNGCTITVTSRDGYVRETYRIDVYRLNNNAYLHDLQLQGHGITPAFDSLNYRYMAQVPATTTAITLLPTLSDPKGEVMGNFTNRPITIGSNRFDVPVRAEDWDTMRTYTVLVEREKYPPVEETQVLQINVNGRDLLSAPVYSYSGQYSGGCGESQFTITITPAQEGVLDVPNPSTITIDALAGFDTLRFHVTSADGSMISAHRLILEKRFDFDEVVETMWDDNSFMLDISLLNEHGIAVSYDSPYRWYKGGNPIPGGFLPTLSAGPSASDRFEYGVPYYLTMQTEDSVVLRTCEKVLTEKSASMPGVYPNPVVTNQPFTLSLERVGGVVEVYSAHGAHLMTRLVQGKQLTLTLPEKGVYLVKHVIDGEVCGVFKVIVK